MHLHSKRVDGWKRSSLRAIVMLLLELNVEHLICLTKHPTESSLAVDRYIKTKGCYAKSVYANKTTKKSACLRQAEHEKVMKTETYGRAAIR